MFTYLMRENENGFRRVLSNVLAKDEKELHEIGTKAKAYALTEKNNVKQAEKLSVFIESLDLEKCSSVLSWSHKVPNNT